MSFLVKKTNESKTNKEPQKRNSMVDFSRAGNSLVFERHGIEQLNLESTQITIGNYTQSEVRELIEDYASPQSQESLLEVADILYIRSPHFRRLVQYFSDMPTFAYGIMPKDDLQSESNPERIREQYMEIAKFANLLNMKHEYRKVLLEVFKSEIFFGYVHYNDDDFYIQKMPREICAISSVEDGVFNYSINMPLLEDNIDVYKYTMPQEVIDLYNEWLRENQSGNDSSNNRRGNSNQRGDAPESIQKEDEMVLGDWKELSSENAICIKFDENNHNLNVPPFAGSFDSVFEIDGYKASRRNKEQIDNYMMIFQKIPMRSDTENNNDFTIDYDSVSYFHEELSESVPESVGVVTTPMELSPIEFDKDSIDVDNVSKAERDFWSGSGTSQALFSTENNTTQGIKASIGTDEQIVFALLRQLQRWTNRFAKNTFGDLMFSIEILDVTYFNRQDFYKNLLELSQYGVPVKTLIPSAMGIEPLQVVGLSYLENDIFGIHESWIPLQSSHTMSNKDKVSTTEDTGGRPREDLDDLSDESLRKT